MASKTHGYHAVMHIQQHLKAQYNSPDTAVDRRSRERSERGPPVRRGARTVLREAPARDGLPSGLDRLRVEAGLGLGPGGAVHAGGAAGGPVEAGAAVLGAAAGRGAQHGDGAPAAVCGSGPALSEAAVGAAGGAAQAKAGDHWEDRQAWGASEAEWGGVGALYRLGVRVGGAAGSLGSVKALGVAGGGAEVEAAVEGLATGAGLLLGNGGLATEGSDGLTLGDVAARGARRSWTQRQELQLRPRLHTGHRRQDRERRAEHAEMDSKQAIVMTFL